MPEEPAVPGENPDSASEEAPEEVPAAEEDFPVEETAAIIEAESETIGESADIPVEDTAVVTDAEPVVRQRLRSQEKIVMPGERARRQMPQSQKHRAGYRKSLMRQADTVALIRPAKRIRPIEAASSTPEHR